jgi:hypothetical protein
MCMQSPIRTAFFVRARRSEKRHICRSGARAVVRASVVRFDVEDERILRGDVDRSNHLGDFRFGSSGPLNEDKYGARGLSRGEEVVKMAYEHGCSPIGLRLRSVFRSPYAAPDLPIGALIRMRVARLSCEVDR